MMGEIERSEDGRYVVVNGRRWRTSDPSIPEALRTQLVSELMAARRAVKAELPTGSGLAAARQRVNDAKVALGERGAPWWEQPDPDEQRRRIAATLRSLLQSREPPKTICPSEVARTVGGHNWRPMMTVVREVALELHAGGDLEVTQSGAVIDPTTTTTGPIRYRRRPAALDV